MKNKPFVVSSHGFESIKEAEEKVNSWYQAGQLDKKIKLYRVVEEYRPRIKFVKVKK